MTKADRVLLYLYVLATLVAMLDFIKWRPH